MHTRGLGEFAAYAQNLRRGHLAGLLEHSVEAMRARRSPPDIIDLLFGGEFARQGLDDQRPATPRHALRGLSQEPPAHS